MNIARYLLKRLSIAAAILVVMSSILFCTSRTTDDPRMLIVDETTTAEQWEAWGNELGLHRPLVVQYVVWLGDSVRADFGTSRERKTSARTIALEHATASLRLLAGGILAATVFSAVAIFAMAYIGQQGHGYEHVGRWARIIVPAIPPILPGILLAHTFFLNTLLFPIAGNGVWSYVLPSAAMGIAIAYAVVRFFRAARNELAGPGNTIESQSADPHSGGHGPASVAKHMLLNLLRSSRILLPILFAVVLFTELTFELRGLSNFTSLQTLAFDLPLAASALMLLTIAYVIVMLMIDVARAFADPSVRRDPYDVPTTGSGLVAGTWHTPAREWPVFGSRPVIALALFGTIVLLAIIVPFAVDFHGNLIGLDWLNRIFLDFRFVLLTLAFALILAAVVGTVAAHIANRYGGFVDRSLVWLFGLFTSFPVLLLGLAGSFYWAIYFWIMSLSGAYLAPFTPDYVQYSMYPALMLATFFSGMFFHRVRTDTRLSCEQQNSVDRRVVVGILKVAAVSAGPVVMMGAILDAAGVYGASGWGGPIGRGQYALASIWWTLLAALVLILTILSLNFLGQWVKERLDQQQDQPIADSAEAPAEPDVASVN